MDKKIVVPDIIVLGQINEDVAMSIVSDRRCLLPPAYHVVYESKRIEDDKILQSIKFMHFMN